MQIIVALGIMLLPAGLAVAQDIYLADLEQSAEGIQLGVPVNITAREGYDNQPSFSPGGKTILFTSLREDETDIFEYRIETGEVTQLTDTPDMPEYSPIPGADDTDFTVVRDNTVPNQSVWRIARAGGVSEWALTSQEPVGYYAFNDRGDVLAWLRYGFVIQLMIPDKNESRFVTGNAAPSAPKIVPGSDRFSFVHRQANGETWIKVLDPADLSVRPVAPLPGEQIEYAWTMNGGLLAVIDDVLSAWPVGSTEWTPVADLAGLGLANAYRLMVSPDGTRLAIVADDPAD